MKTVIQSHHIVYQNDKHKQKEVVVKIYKGEHWAITQLSRRKKISKGFIKALKHWVLLNEDEAVDLDNEDEKFISDCLKKEGKDKNV